MTQWPGKDPKVALVTGATGYVGSHLAKALVRDGWKVHALLREASDSSELGKSGKQIKLHRLSVQAAEIAQIVKEAKPDVVFHLASEVLIRHEMDDVEDLIESNILFGTQVLEGMAQAGSRNFVNAGSFWQHYGGAAYNPVNLYGATKQAFEAILAYYVQCHSICAVTLKLFDVYGPQDSRNKVFQQLNQAARTGEVLPMSPGEQLLDLVYIDDVVSAFLRAAEVLILGNQKLEPSYAVSSGRHISLKEVVSLYGRLTGHRPNVKWGGRPYREREVMKPWKGPTLPGWKPEVNLETGIRLMTYDSAVPHPTKVLVSGGGKSPR